MKAKNASTFISPGIDASNDWISSFIVGMDLMDLSGRRIRNVRSAFKLSASTLGSIPTMLTATMKKSRLFQGSLM